MSTSGKVIHDLTQEFVSAKWDVRGGFSAKSREILAGLYLTVFVNQHDEPICDNNKRGRDAGMTVVRANGTTLKFGKFENGVVERYRENYTHLRFMHDGGREELGAFPGCMALLLVLDLTGASKDVVRNSEQRLKQLTLDYIEKTGRKGPPQNGNAESRHIVGSNPTKEELVGLLEQLEIANCEQATTHAGPPDEAPQHGAGAGPEGAYWLVWTYRDHEPPGVRGLPCTCGLHRFMAMRATEAHFRSIPRPGRLGARAGVFHSPWTCPPKGRLGQPYPRGLAVPLEGAEVEWLREQAAVWDSPPHDPV